MSARRTAPLTLAVGLTLALATTASAQAIGRKETNFEWSGTIAKGAWLHIVSPNGAITVTQGSGDKVQIRAEKELRGNDPEDIGFIAVQDHGNIAFCAVYDDDDDCSVDRYSSNRSHRRWFRSSPRVNLTVTVPAGVNVRAGSGNGAVSVSGAGETEASTGNGRVRVSDAAGGVHASSGNGVISVDGAHGPVEASTGNGDVTVTTSLGPVTASSGNGDIDVSMAALSSDKDMTFSTGNGRVTISVPANFAADVETDTGNGHFESDFPIMMHGRISPTHIRGTIGDGGNGRRLRVSTGNGAIEIRKNG